MKKSEFDELFKSVLDRCSKELQEETGETLAEEIKALAELISTRAKYC